MSKEKKAFFPKGMQEKTSQVSNKMLEKGWGVFGNISGILQYSNDEEIELMRATRMFLYMLVIFSVISVFWMGLSRLDVVSAAEGSVKPSSQVKSIQHLEGGIVENILVEEGDTVKAGQLLLVLERTFTGSSVTRLGNQIDQLLAKKARFEAESKWGNSITFPQKLLSRSAESYVGAAFCNI